MNVRQILASHLKSIGADGLCAEECGCGLDDLMPCGFERDISECKPAAKQKCDQKCGRGYCDGEGGDCYRPMNTTTKEVNDENKAA